MKQEDKRRWAPGSLAVIAAFIAMLLVGLLVVDDYGESTDERVERQSSIISYQEINRVLFGRETFTYMTDHPPIAEYRDRHYGVAVQLPLVAAEDLYRHLYGKDMTNRQILQMRHRYTFLVYFLGLLCFYFLLKRLFHSRWLALTGVGMIFLFGRFFAQSFYNIKDIMFASLMMIALRLMERILAGNRKPFACLLFAFSCAVLVSSRIIGAALPLFCLAVMLRQDILAARKAIPPTKQGILGKAQPYLWICCAYPLWLAVTPASWSAPLSFSLQYMRVFSNFERWTGQIPYLGTMYDHSSTPWYYFIGYIALTVPLVNQAFCLTGTFCYGRNLLSKRRQQQGTAGLLVLFSLLMILCTLVYQAISHPVVYNGWRHAYYLYPLLVLVAVYGLGKCWNSAKERKRQWLKVGLICTVSGSLIFNGVQIAVNHPFEYALFNIAGKPMATGFERDYWSMADERLLDWATEQGLELPSEQWIHCHVEAEAVPGYLAEKLTDQTEYVLLNYNLLINTNALTVEGFTEIHSIWVDQAKIYALLKRNEKLLDDPPYAAVTIE